MPYELNSNFIDVSFDPFNELSDVDNERNMFCYDYIDDYCDTVDMAKRTLSNCKYYEPDTLPYNKFRGTSFYFNNIDGFQSNFTEFRNQCLNLDMSYDFYCFNETNVKADSLHDFEIDGYNSEFYYSIDKKSKGSGLAIYYRNNLKFTVDKSLTLRNKHFESLGGKLKCEFGYMYVIVIYRFNYNTNIDTFFTTLSSLLERVSEQPCIVLGDFNFDTLKCDAVSHVQRYIDSFMCTFDK